MITFYTVDAEWIFIEAVEIDPLGQLPSPCFTLAPPETTGSEVARWNGVGWDVLDERPVLVPPPAPIPQVVTMRQARLALLQQGLLASIQPAIDSLDEPHRSAARIEWEYSQTVERLRPFVLLLAQALNLTDDDLDEIFTLADTL